MSKGVREGGKEGERKRMREDSNCAKRGGGGGGGGWGGVMAFGGGRCLSRLADKSEQKSTMFQFLSGSSSPSDNTLL